MCVALPVPWAHTTLRILKRGQCEEFDKFKPLISNMAVMNTVNEYHLGFISKGIRYEERKQRDFVGGRWWKIFQTRVSVTFGSLSPVGNITCAVAEEASNMSITPSWVWVLASVLSFKTALLFWNFSFCFSKTKMRPRVPVGCDNVDKERSIWCTTVFNPVLRQWQSRRVVAAMLSHSTVSSVIVWTEKENSPWVFLAVCPCTGNLRDTWEGVI